MARRLTSSPFIGWFTIPGGQENGKNIWYSIKFRNMRYMINHYRGEAMVLGMTTIRKQEQRFYSRMSNWLPRFLGRRTIWRFQTDAIISGEAMRRRYSYGSLLASVAQSSNISLDRQFFVRISEAFGNRIIDLQHQVMNDYLERYYGRKSF